MSAVIVTDTGAFIANTPSMEPADTKDTSKELLPKARCGSLFIYELLFYCIRRMTKCMSSAF